MRVLVLLPVLYGAAVFQTAFGGLWRIGHVEPNLLAVTAIVWLLLVPGRRMFLAAGAAGLLEDLLVPGRVGLGMACFLVVGYAVGQVRARSPIDRLVVQLAVVFVAASALAVCQASMHWLMTPTPVSLSSLLRRALGVGAYTAGLSLPVLMVAGWFRPRPLPALDV